jgi:hypothetical protein
MELFQRHQHFFRVFSLGNNAKIVLNGKDFGGPGAKDCLVVSQNDLQHLFASFAFTNELVLIDHAGDSALGFFTFGGIGCGGYGSAIFADDSPRAADLNIGGCSQHFGGKSDVKFNGRPDFKIEIGHDVHTGCAHIGRGSAIVPALAMDFNGQFQWESFPGSSF